MSIVLILAGLLAICLGWWLAFHISEEKVYRLFDSWWASKMGEEDAEGLKVALGTLFCVFLLFIGIVFAGLGVAQLLGWK